MILLLMATGLDQETAFSAVAACLNNLGPGLGDVGRNFASIFNYRKLGFAHVGTFHQCSWSVADSAPADLLLFEMMEADWRAKGSV